MPPEKHREISVKGGKASQANGRGHKFTSEEARRVGRKGGLVSAAIPGRMSELARKGGTVVSSDRAYMSMLGKKGGLAMQAAKRNAKQD